MEKVAVSGPIAGWQVKCFNNPGLHVFGDTKIECRDNRIVAAWQRTGP
ncbi:MAG: hypothetical protein M5R36_02275 [Deltaproteobacteria bacterium]|nr:hypothetical protein [Deltaproteobacteria bacterium]